MTRKLAEGLVTARLVAAPRRMTPAEFAGALAMLELTHEEAATVLGVANRQRVSEWARGRRPVPLYVSAHLETLLRTRVAQRR